MKKEQKQFVLFKDLEQMHVFTCIVGAYIGHFQPDDENNPIVRLSDYFEDEQAAQAALDRQDWSPISRSVIHH